MGAARHGEVEDRGFDAVGAGAAVDDPRATFAEGVADVRRLRRAHVTERIGARRGERAPGETQHLAEKRVGRDADRDGVLAGRDEIRHDGLTPQHDREGTRPEVSELGQPRIGVGDLGERGLVEHMDDERIEERAAFDREDLGERRRVRRIGGEAVDRLRRQGHAGALTQQLGRPGQVGGGGSQEAGGGRGQGGGGYADGQRESRPIYREASPGATSQTRQQKSRLRRRPGEVVARTITSS